MEHVIDSSRFHHNWDRDREPTLRIANGDSVRFDLRMAGAEQIHEGDSYADTRFDFDTIYRLLGPVFVDGAAPGDTLRVEIVSLTPGDWGWGGAEPGLGLLADDFPEPFVRTFDLRGRDSVSVCPGVTVPFAPFLGTMGTVPDVPGPIRSAPPHAGGGNIDTRHLTEGTTLWLPIWCEGALFSCGDPHATQGDGEVCLTALECDMLATLRFSVERRTIGAPRFATPGALTPKVDSRGHYGTMGIGPDLMEGARRAVREAIVWLVDTYGLSREDAYLTCSLAGDLKLLEVVDAGVWNVGFTLPLSILEHREERPIG
jgi:acetamidase/formamidase